MRSGRILLTGANGFVGGHLAARATAQGRTVVPLDGDVRDAGLVQRAVADTAPDAVVHLASRKPSAGRDRWEALSDEIAMAGNLFRALHEAAPDATLLVAGSAAQYGHGAPQPLAETAPLAPVSAYGAIKCVLERASTDRALRSETRVIWARTFNTLGPGQQPETPAADWARRVADAERAGGGVVRTGDLDIVRDFLDVRDVADAYLALLDGDVEGPVNVGSGSPTRLKDLAGLFIDAATVPLSVERDLQLQRPDDPPYVVADVALLTSTTSWRPSWTLKQSAGDMLAAARTAVATGSR